jgi:hypothetical protein
LPSPTPTEVGGQPRPGPRPQLLIASPNGAESLDLEYLRELSAHGFDVDYTDSLESLTVERLRESDVVVIFSSPTANLPADDPETALRAKAFRLLLEGYVQNGGGLLVLSSASSSAEHPLAELLAPWGARVPPYRLSEQDPARVGQIDRLRQGGALAYTENVANSPLTDGVKRIWYPTSRVFAAAMTQPLELSADWDVLVRTAPSVVALPIDAPVGTKSDARAVPIFAIRAWGAGRVALNPEWMQFSLGAGTKWLYDRVVLERGLTGRKSDYGRLLENTLRWLAAPRPTLRAAKAAPRHALAPPNAADEVKAQFKTSPLAYDARALETSPDRPGLRILRGVIGARTTRAGTQPWKVADYAKAARDAKLDFVIFLEPLEQLTPEQLSQLTRDCAAHSGPDLLLLPGYSLRSNVGNRMFFYGIDPPYPPEDLLKGADRRTIYLQQQDADGNFTGYGTTYEHWVLQNFHGRSAQVGYYDFAQSPGGVRLRDARQYSAVGVRYYRSGRLVEDLEHEYRVTTAATIAPTPLSVHEVDSPNELRTQARAARGLTYVSGYNLKPDDNFGVIGRGLRWLSQYDASHAFASSGPMIWEWAGVFRAYTYGAEGYSPERSAFLAPLHVTSAVGLKEISVFDGPRLFMRLQLHGEHVLRRTLVLDCSVQRNLTLVVKDVRGGSALSHPSRLWPEGALAPIFCSDHVNDCAGMRMARGPWAPWLTPAPAVPASEAGNTWDGGPLAVMPAIHNEDTMPVFEVNGRRFDTHRWASFPLLDLADEESVGTRAVRTRAYAERLKQVINPWHTFGPLEPRVSDIAVTHVLRQWTMPSEGPLPTGWAAAPVRRGVNVSSLRIELSSRAALEADKLSFVRLSPRGEASVYWLDGSTDPASPTAELAAQNSRRVLGRGDAFAVTGAGRNTHIVFNRTPEIEVEFVPGTLDLRAGSPRTPLGRAVFEMVSHAFPLDAALDERGLAEYVRYQHAPDGFKVLRGTRAESPGVLSVEAVEGVVELEAAQAQTAFTLPLEVAGLNTTWSAGVLQQRGWSPGFYASPAGRYRALAVDDEGRAILPLHTGRSAQKAIVGHPVVGSQNGKALRILVTCLGGTPTMRWHVSVNNPTSHPIEAELRQAMPLPGLAFERITIRLAPGEWRVLQ